MQSWVVTSPHAILSADKGRQKREGKTEERREDRREKGRQKREGKTEERREERRERGREKREGKTQERRDAGRENNSEISFEFTNIHDYGSIFMADLNPTLTYYGRPKPTTYYGRS